MLDSEYRISPRPTRQNKAQKTDPTLEKKEDYQQQSQDTRTTDSSRLSEFFPSDHASFGGSCIQPLSAISLSAYQARRTETPLGVLEYVSGIRPSFDTILRNVLATNRSTTSAIFLSLDLFNSISCSSASRSTFRSSSESSVINRNPQTRRRQSVRIGLLKSNA